MSLKAQLAAAARAIRDGDAAPPPELVGPISVHRNTHRISLTEALAENFSTLAALVGPEWFAQAARRFIAAHPPRAAHLSAYGAMFPAFLAALPEEAACPPWAGDVARFDWAWISCWCADAAPHLTAADAAALPMDSLAERSLPLHPAARLFASPWPVTMLWRWARAGGAGAAPDLSAGADWALLTRPEEEVIVHPLDPAQFDFFSSLADGAPLGDAAAQAGVGFDLSAALALGLRSGAWRAGP